MGPGAPILREANVRVTVPFFDLDPMHVVWHGNYLKYFDLARQQLFDQSGIDLYQTAVDNGIYFPVVKSFVKHLHPLQFRDECEVIARLLEVKHRIVVEFELRRLPHGPVCAKGRSEQVAVEASTQKLLLDIPLNIQNALQQGP
jgi:acyl-CoA thioester hydrolase